MWNEKFSHSSFLLLIFADEMNTEGKKILIVDDESSISSALATYLRLEGWETDTAASAAEALDCDVASYSLFILDIMMDGMSGTELAEVLHSRPDTCRTPIIFLTARTGEDDMVEALRNGADDYIAKPFSMKNVAARVQAVMRRVSAPIAPEPGVTVDRASLSCRVDGNPVQLPRKEFEILALLLENPGRIFTREELLARVWPDKVIVTDRSVDVHIRRLRMALGSYGKNIVSRSGYGYGWQN